LRETSIELRESSPVAQIILRESSCEFARIVSTLRESSVNRVILGRWMG